MKSARLFITILLSVYYMATSPDLFSQNLTTNYSQLKYELDNVLSDQLKSEEPGCAVLVAIKGQIIYKNATVPASNNTGKTLNTKIAFRSDNEILNNYKHIQNVSKELARKGFKTSDSMVAKNVSGYEINYGSRSTIPILILRKTDISNRFKTSIIYAPEEDIYIEVLTNNEITDSNNPIQTIFNKVLTEVFGSLDFKDNGGSRLVFYHFLLTAKVLPMGGILERGKTTHVWINGDTKNLHYTTDGNEPIQFTEDMFFRN